jgi:hypothetical protein
MLLDDTLYAYIDDAIYYIAEYENGKWERSIPLPMISYNVRTDISNEEAMLITNNKVVDSLFDQITKEIEWENREKTEEEKAIDFFETLIHMYKNDYHLLKKDKPNFKYSIKDLDETYGGNLYNEISEYYDEYLKFKDSIFAELKLIKTNNDYIMEFKK